MSDSTQSSVATEKEVRTDSSKYNTGTRQLQTFHEEVNTAYNHHIIIEAFKNGRAKDITDGEKAPIEYGEALPAFIVGSGASLDNAIPYLKDWEGGIFCTTSHAITLIHLGVEPTHIVALDCFCSWDELKGIDWKGTKTKLIVQPGVHPSLIENWPNEMLMFLNNNGRADSFYATTQKRMYSHREGDFRMATFVFYIRTEIILFACSPPTQIFCASILGYGNLFLCGCDFGVNYGKERFTEWKIDDSGNWQEFPHPFILDEKAIENKELLLSNNGLYTKVGHLYYKKNLMSAWRLCAKTIYTTDKGIITEMPYVSIKQVIKQKGKKFKQQGIPFISKQSEEYLASVGAYVIETNAGLSFIEAVDPFVDLPHFMTEVNKRYRCDKCNTKFMFDAPPKKEDKCPECKEGNLIKEIDVDIEANMRRIISRIHKGST